ncbi:hypothetical protein ABZ705_22875 [Streptomyces sp. NPDC006984]|uniref:hypothetical protein n=1 Tax=Streptomyces sp. NPDC006984 TaxID=3155463 RepID=UPI0033D59289
MGRLSAQTATTPTLATSPAAMRAGSLSLRGEADFHALEHVDGTLYGYGSTGSRLRVSEDGAAWDDRARLQALNIAVHPGAPDTVLATTADGIARSTDGGRTFAAGGQPVMAFLSWAEPGALYGLDGSGGLHRSPDAGATLEKTGTVPGGRPQAVTGRSGDGRRAEPRRRAAVDRRAPEHPR